MRKRGERREEKEDKWFNKCVLIKKAKGKQKIGKASCSIIENSINYRKKIYIRNKRKINESNEKRKKNDERK